VSSYTTRQPEFGGWGFNLPRGEACLEKWDLIPDDTDVLVTHGPPLGFGDSLQHGGRSGCVQLLHVVQERVRPKYHVFGHIHEGEGGWSCVCVCVCVLFPNLTKPCS